jgi:hypothetical protein
MMAGGGAYPPGLSFLREQESYTSKPLDPGRSLAKQDHNSRHKGTRDSRLCGNDISVPQPAWSSSDQATLSRQGRGDPHPACCAGHPLPLGERGERRAGRWGAMVADSRIG